MSEHAGGLAVAADQSLRVSMSRRLVALEPEGALRWAVEIDGRGPQTDWAWHLPSTPLVLAEDHCVVTFGQSALFVSASGRMLARVHTHSMLDNSGPAPNLAPDGTLILTTMLGELLRLSETSLVELAAGFGYDLVAPAIDDEGRMALAGYAGKGLVLAEPSGAIVWRSGLRYADLMPSMDAEGRVACGSLNEERSRILDREGNVLADHPEAASFAVSERGWVALSERSLAGLDPTGELRWQRAGGFKGRWGRVGALVDAAARVFAPVGTSLVALDSDGRERFVVALPSPPLDLALVAPGRIAVALAEGLFFVD